MLFEFVQLPLLFNLFSTVLLTGSIPARCRNRTKGGVFALHPTMYKVYAGQQLHVTCDAYKLLRLTRRSNAPMPGVTWYKITNRLVPMEKHNQTSELFRIHRFLEDGVLHIISAQPALHAGRFYCELTDAGCNIHGSYADIEVIVCKWRKKGYRGYCAYGVCKVRNNSLKHVTMTCTCEPGYSGAYCTYRSPLYSEQMYIPWYPFTLFLLAIAIIPITLSIVKAQSDKVRNFAKHLE